MLSWYHQELATLQALFNSDVPKHTATLAVSTDPLYAAITKAGGIHVHHKKKMMELLIFSQAVIIAFYFYGTPE